jgi:hypothetical protein
VVHIVFGIGRGEDMVVSGAEVEGELSRVLEGREEVTIWVEGFACGWAEGCWHACLHVQAGADKM